MRWLLRSRAALAKDLVVAALLMNTGLALRAQVASIKEYPVPDPNSEPSAITPGPDGALWFTEANVRRVGRITTAGEITEYSSPNLPTAIVGAITVGPDGALWFTEGDVSRIARITTTGSVMEFPIPTTGGYPGAITLGPDGALWFAEILGGKIGRSTAAGVITEYPLNTNSAPEGITKGADGALWFTEYIGKIGRITTDGVITEYPVANANRQPFGITAGPDGALWFSENSFGVGRITTAGVITEYPVPSANTGGPFGITAGPDVALWFTLGCSSSGVCKIGRITTAGVVTEYALPTGFSGPYGITTGPDGALWVAESGRGGIAQVVLSSPSTPPSVSCMPTPTTLWPPNGKPVTVTVAGTITAGTSVLIPGSAEYTVSDEYGQVQPNGNIVLGPGGTYSFAISLTAGRNGNDEDGRIYTIVVEVEDALGKIGLCSAIVRVPHDEGP